MARGEALRTGNARQCGNHRSRRIRSSCAAERARARSRTGTPSTMGSLEREAEETGVSARAVTAAVKSAGGEAEVMRAEMQRFLGVIKTV